MAISAIESLAEEFGDGFSGTVIVPNSTLKQQWHDFICEFTGGQQDSNGHWSGGSSQIIVDGDRKKRDVLYARAIKERPRYTIIGYNQVVDDYNVVIKLPWDYAIGDEVTSIKSFDSDRSQALKTIRPEFIYGLSGDPIENRADELFSIMQWIDPTVLGRDDLFDEYYCVRSPKGFIVAYKHLDVLHEIMNESKAWVLKKASDPDVAPFMPVKKPRIIEYAELDSVGAEMYDYIVDGLLEDLAELSRLGIGHIDVAAHYAGSKDAKAAHGKAASKLMAARMLLAHPYALRESARKYLTAPEREAKLTTIRRRDGRVIKVMKQPPKPGSKYAAALVESGAMDDVFAHPKLDKAVEILDAILEADPKNKIVVFSTLKDALRALAAMYEGEAVLHHGDMSAKQKNESKRLFQREPHIRLFMSSDSGAYGTDLPQANWLLNYDVPFSAGASRQRNARITRGSSLDYWSHTQVVDLLMRDTLECHYYERTMRKIELGDAVKSGRKSTSEVTMSAMSLTEFLSRHHPVSDMREALAG